MLKEFGHQIADRSVDRTARMTELIKFGFGHPLKSISIPTARCLDYISFKRRLTE